jgi:hypothetical protein
MRFTTIAKRSLEAGLSLSTLSERLGMHRSYISRMKQNRAVAERPMARAALRLIQEHWLLAQHSNRSVVEERTEAVFESAARRNRVEGPGEPKVCVVLSSGAWEKVSDLLETLDPQSICYRLAGVVR